MFAWWLFGLFLILFDEFLEAYTYMIMSLAEKRTRPKMNNIILKILFPCC